MFGLLNFCNVILIEFVKEGRIKEYGYFVIKIEFVLY